MEYLNEFHQWLESNPLPVNARWLYISLLNVFNRAGWPDQVQVDTLRLMLMTDCQKDAAYRARDRLRDAGFISYRRGKKGAPTTYFLSDKTTKSATENATENATESATRNATPIKTKTKIKTKTISPLPPKKENWGFGTELSAALSDWLTYREEIGRGYTPTGLKSLITEVQKNIAQYGETAMANVIRMTMASGWDGIVWDKLKKLDGPASSPGSSSRTPRDHPSSVMDDMARMEKYLQKLRAERETEVGSE